MGADPLVTDAYVCHECTEWHSGYMRVGEDKCRRSLAPAPRDPRSDSMYRIYVRVSTADQEPATQRLRLRVALGARGVDPDGPDVIWYEDIASAKSLDRPALTRLLAEIRRGDVYVVQRADRMSRSVADFVSVTSDLHSIGAEIWCTDQPVDTATPMGRAFWQILGVFGELERAMLIARTLDGIARARAEGKATGRHPGACGITYRCPWGVDHSPEAIERRRRRKGSRPGPLSKGVPPARASPPHTPLPGGKGG